MWKYFATLLLRNKAVFTGTVLVLTVFMGYQAYKMELSYEFAKILPESDSTFIEYQNFRKQFGEDGNIMVMGFADKDLFQLNKFRDWTKVNNDIKKVSGVRDILSLPTLYSLSVNDSLGKFIASPIVKRDITS